MAKLVRQDLPPPPPVAPIEELPVEEEIPDPEVPEEVPPEDVPESVEQPMVAAVDEPDVKEEVKSKGILAFRESFATTASLRPSTQLGSDARVRSAGEDAVGRPSRNMVTSNAPGSSGGINLAAISRMKRSRSCSIATRRLSTGCTTASYARIRHCGAR
jgi:hypothetical protein